MKEFILYLLIAFLFITCKKENALDCFRSNGKDITKTISVPEFIIIDVKSNMEVNVTKGNDFKVEITAGKHIISNITATVKNTTLEIQNSNTCNFVRGYKRVIKVNITVPYLRKMINNGVGTLTLDSTFLQDSIVARAESSGDIHVNGKYDVLISSSHGNGDIYINGTCNSFYVYTYGTNFLHAENLLVRDNIFVENLSLGDCYINCTGLYKFEYNIWNEGNIYYKGKPFLITDYSASGVKGKAIQKD